MPAEAAIPIVEAWSRGRVVAGSIEAAAAALGAGGLIGLPTETVYGLAAPAEAPASVARIYAVKNRPADHPVIVHVAGSQSLDRFCRDVPGYARNLAESLWPGPLTLVLPRSPRAGDYLTGGQDTVAVRCPAHPVALAVIRAAGALAAPSANRFGRLSPTTADAVLQELGPALDPARDLILDGGPCPVGVESTIADCTGELPRILRWGAVEPDQIAQVGGRPVSEQASSVRAPGTLSSHYAPATPLRVVADAQAALAVPTAGLLALASVATPPGVQRLAAPDDPAAYAAVLYRALRDADSLGLAAVFAIPPPTQTAIGRAVTDRLQRAAAEK